MLIVQKFGGTSVGSLSTIQQVVAKIIKTRAAGHEVVVVVSAMAGETDRLINLAQQIQSDPDPREYAVLVTTAEQVSIALVTMALIAQGHAARSFTGEQAQIYTDHWHKKARILGIDSGPVRAALAAGQIPVVAGFQGVTKEGDITTLGRGGSDTTAVALAVALQADECQIYTDVDGVYTADPRLVSKAQCLETITFAEMMELSSLGAKVLQQRSVEFAGKYQVPLRVLSSFSESKGTFIQLTEGGDERSAVTSISLSRQETKLTFRNLPQYKASAEILAQLSAAQIDIDMLVQQNTAPDTIDFSFTIARDDYPKALIILDKWLGEEPAYEWLADTAVAKISLVGAGLRSHPGVMSALFKALAAEKIAIQLVSSSEIKLSLLVAERDAERGVRALHDAFGLDGQKITFQNSAL